MRLLSSVTKKALLAFGYPRLNIDPTIDNLSNNNYNSKNTASSLYNVGATKIRMSTDIPACQLFYPAADDDLKKKKNENENNKKFIPYFRKEAVTGMIDYLNGFGDGVLQMLEEKSHPCQQYYDCNPITMTTTMNRNNENNDDDESNSNTNNKFPLLLFSHGLGGNMELYTELCAMIASYGYIVVAIEHEDGSASYAASSASFDDEKKVKEKQIPYQQPLSNAKVPYSRQKVLDMRTPMLEQRVNEIQQIYNYMSTATATNENDVPSSKLVQQIISITNINELHLVGHSFGGATQLLAAQKWMTSSKAVTERTETDTEAERRKSSATTTIIGTGDSSGGGIATAVVVAAPTTTVVTTNTISNTATTKIPPIPKSIMVLDAWCYALSDEILNNGISISVSVDDDDDDDDDEQQAQQQQYPKIISILSQDWALTNQERKQTLQFLKNCNNNNNNNVSSYYAKDSVHQSFSDTECWLPTYIARKTFGMRGRKEDRHITIRSCVKEFMKQQTSTQEQQTSTQHKNNDDDNNNNNNNNILIPFPYK